MEDDVNTFRFDVRDYRTGEKISFKINIGNITLPHHMKLDIPPDKYLVDYAEKAIANDPSYGGMNYYAAKELHIPFEYTPTVVVVAKQTTGDPKHRKEKLNQTIAHEIIEAEIMATGQPYHIAHMYAMEFEKGIHHEIEDNL